ncbi:MAG: peptidylprolyl isomerase [Candidatus Marinimicrobia bacterium]|nr:peptidylprolyl isomerase [Candidatus Neomarinimicrobiota bacterium]
MKKALVLFLIFGLFFISCGKKVSGPKYKKGTEEYKFFEVMAKTTPYMAPDTTVELIKTNEFIVVNHDVMPLVFQTMRGDTASFVNRDSKQIVKFIDRIVSQYGTTELLLADAGKHNVKINKKELEDELSKIYSRYGGEEKFGAMVEKQGTTIDDVKKDLKKNLTIKKYFNDVIFSEIKINEAKIKERYEKSKDNYNKEVATVRHILFLTKNNSDSEKVEIKATALKVLEKARSGEDFETLVKKYSEDPGSKENGGLYENFQRGRMVKSFEDVAFSAPIGSISDLVETQYGYHIIKIVDRKDNLSYEEVKDEIEEQLKQVKERSMAPIVIDSLKQVYNYEKLLKNN